MRTLEPSTTFPGKNGQPLQRDTDTPLMSEPWFPAVGFQGGRPDLRARLSPQDDPDLGQGDVGVEVRGRDPEFAEDYVVRAASCAIEVHRPNDGGLLRVATTSERASLFNALAGTLVRAKRDSETTAGRLSEAVRTMSGCRP